MDMIIDGEYVGGDNRFSVRNPFNGREVDTVPIAGRDDVLRALEAAHRAKGAMSDLSARRISENLHDVADELRAEMDEFARLITLESGKPIRFSRDEVKRSVETARLCAEEAGRLYGESIPMDAGIGGKGLIGFTVRIPLGVVAAITPFNYPLNLAIHKVGPALAAGNTTVLKPSLEAPLSALRLCEILNEHFPQGAVNALTGRGREVGDVIIDSPLVDKITFTGSVEVGRYISRRASMKKVTLELGGNDPLIVMDDADIDSAVEGAVRGSYLYSGQVCIAVKRMIVHKDVADEFADKLVEKTRRLRSGDPLDAETDIGPLINEEAAIEVERRIEDAVDDGAELLHGGSRRGNFVEPTVLDYVRPEMDVVAEETFGPVSPIIRFADADEALRIANGTCYALQAGVFTENIGTALRMASEIDAGTVLVNKQSTFRVDHMPFGGFKCSGMGKEGVKYAIEDMTRTKLVVLNSR
ncbi:aldehyde dehydrogenase family protein [Methanothermobacter sp. KEPCO-1]|uniref:lactaldehyde dehydrogenase n=1 Tax=Methanothermobacter sp. KEPCO-1 TaxID=2603820 RepID=UPI0011CA1A18|nr:lactaldehyde dehydrogenase [Methanothermobacter sp. KEPCO-1]QEF94866.1 aldehyde dehydrogenase family protein [Methanothermobacter sp. KEPCO-1]